MNRPQPTKVALVIVAFSSSQNARYPEEVAQHANCPCIDADSLSAVTPEADPDRPLKVWIMKNRLSERIVFDGAIFNPARAKTITEFLAQRGFRVEVVWSVSPKAVVPAEVAAAKPIFAQNSQTVSFHEIDAAKPALVRRRIGEIMGIQMAASSQKTRRPATIAELNPTRGFQFAIA